MPRKAAPPGYWTPKEAIDHLKQAGAIDTDTMFYRYVEQRNLKRHVPAGRTHGYYKQDEIEALAHDIQYFYSYIPGAWRENPTSAFVRAAEEDMPTIVEISRAIFNADGSAPIPAEARSCSWTAGRRS